MSYRCQFEGIIINLVTQETMITIHRWVTARETTYQNMESIIEIETLVRIDIAVNNIITVVFTRARSILGELIFIIMTDTQVALVMGNFIATLVETKIKIF